MVDLWLRVWRDEGEDGLVLRARCPVEWREGRWRLAEPLLWDEGGQLPAWIPRLDELDNPVLRWIEASENFGRDASGQVEGPDGTTYEWEVVDLDT